MTTPQTVIVTAQSAADSTKSARAVVSAFGAPPEFAVVTAADQALNTYPSYTVSSPTQFSAMMPRLDTERVEGAAASGKLPGGG